MAESNRGNGRETFSRTGRGAALLQVNVPRAIVHVSLRNATDTSYGPTGEAPGTISRRATSVPNRYTSVSASKHITFTSSK